MSKSSKYILTSFASLATFLSMTALPVLAACATNEVDTGIGCVATDAAGLVKVILRFALGVAGGFAILQIIVGGLKVATSSGNPDQLEEGRQTITAALAGLVFILLAVTILVIIGVDILGIPALSRVGAGIGLPALIPPTR